MSVERRDRIRAYDLYALIGAVLFGLGAIAVVLALVFGGPVTVAVAIVPFFAGVGLGTRLLSGWRPRDRSLDRTVREEVTE
jgi:hypothetical protein